MTVGSSIAFIVVGAILYFAIIAEVPVIDLQAVGVILMVLGVVGLVVSLLDRFGLVPGRRGADERETVVEREPRDRF